MEKNAPYDFSKNLRRFQWGAQLGAEWRAFKHLNVYADLTWGFDDIFRKISIQLLSPCIRFT